MKVDSYSFGSMVIDGKAYDKDLIVFPDKVCPNWWRSQGHTLLIDDLAEVLEYEPDILVVGRGAYSVMVIPESTKEALKEHNIELIQEATPKAYGIFNDQLKQGAKVVGAFHLTC